MTFIVQPTEEGETQKCPNCDVDLVGRLSDYKGRFQDKLQWQSKSERKAHYDKNGNCKGEPNSSNVESNTPSKTSDEYLKNKQTELDQETRDFDDKIQKLIVSAYSNDELTTIYRGIDQLIALEHIIKLKFEEKGIELNAQKIGMYVKLVRGGDNE